MYSKEQVVNYSNKMDHLFNRDRRALISAVIPSEFKFGKRLGRGTFGEVFLLQDPKNKNKELFAVKRIYLDGIDTEKDLILLQNEITILKRAAHSSIVTFHGFSMHENVPCIFMEYMPMGSLRQIIDTNLDMDERNHLEPVISENQISLYTCQILEGLEYLHDRRIIHRDIKAANILLENESKVRLADFGVSKILTDMYTNTAEKGSVHWMAPEIFIELPYNTKVDIWSVGATVVEMATGHPPSWKLRKYQVIFKLGSGKPHEFTLPESTSESLKDFVAKTFIKDSEERPSAKSMIKHSFVAAHTSLPVIHVKQDCNQSSEFDYEANTSYASRFAKCAKNPGHTGFIPVRELIIDRIPGEDTDLHTLILALADLTVMVYCSSLFELQYNFSGFINSVDIYTEDKNVNCLCPICDQSQKQTKSWALIHVITAANQYDKIDVEKAICCVSYDDDSSPNIKLPVQKVGMADMEGDRLVISFNTHDIGLARNLKQKCREYDGLCKKLYDKNIGTRDEDRNVIIVSHPHRGPKKVSFGKLLEKTEETDGSSRLAYDTPTCPGSAGAPVYVTGMCGYSSNHTHSRYFIDDKLGVSGLWFI